jgi:hypothetical protein
LTGQEPDVGSGWDVDNSEVPSSTIPVQTC